MSHPNAAIFPSGREFHQLVEQLAQDADRRRSSTGAPPELAIELIKSRRLGAARIPRMEGGGGYSFRDLLDSIVDLAAADPDVPHILRAHYVFVESCLLEQSRHGNRTHWLALISQGKIIGAAGSELTHTTVGRDAHSTTLDEVDGILHLNGTKFYTTGAKYSDYLNVSAADKEGKTVSAVVPARREGVEHVDDWDGFGQTHTGSGTTKFHNVEVLPAEVLPRAQPDQQPNHTDRRSIGQIILHAIGAGILERVVSDSAALLRQRQRTYYYADSAVPAEDSQLLQVIGEMASSAFLVRSAVLEAGSKIDAALVALSAAAPDARDIEDDAALATSKVKVAVEGLALKVAGDLFAVGGASAIRAPAHLDRHWRNLRTLFSHNPSVYKARAIGDNVVNGTPLPRGAFF